MTLKSVPCPSLPGVVPHSQVGGRGAEPAWLRCEGRGGGSGSGFRLLLCGPLVGGVGPPVEWALTTGRASGNHPSPPSEAREAGLVVTAPPLPSGGPSVATHLPS